MSRTRTAPWDYQRPQAPAPMDGTCIECGGPCYGPDAIPGGHLYTCPKCGTITVPPGLLDDDGYAKHETKH
jgi:hypothetical protein